MNKNWIRWALVAVLLAMLPLFLSSPAIAEVAPLPLDHTVPGNPAVESGWIGEEEYQDPSIHVTVEHQKVKGLPCSIVRIKIADPTQIRTAMSENSFDKTVYVKATALAKHANAIAAVNGDFFKYYDFGYVIRQGEKYREIFSTKYPRDVLLIDDHGDFYGVGHATAEAMADFYANTLPEGRSVINSFTLGPILIQDGELYDFETTEFQWRYKMQRVAIVQLGELEYAIVECDGKADATKGMTIPKFAEYILELFPEAKLAYNLDGGGSTNVIVGGKRIHKNPNTRQICDILYFASAYTED